MTLTFSVHAADYFGIGPCRFRRRDFSSIAKQLRQKHLMAKKWTSDIRKQPTIILPSDFFAFPRRRIFLSISFCPLFRRCSLRQSFVLFCPTFFAFLLPWLFGKAAGCRFYMEQMAWWWPNKKTALPLRWEELLQPFIFTCGF